MGTRILTPLLPLVLGLVLPLSQAQKQHLLDAKPTPAAATISVASLRISQKAWAHFDRARAAFNNHRDEEFNREFAAALAIEPAFASLYLLRAEYEVRLRHFPAAIQDVLTAQHFEPTIAQAATILAGAYNGLHRYNDALILLQAIHGYEAGTWQVTYELTRARIGRGDTEDALRLSAIALRTVPDDYKEVHLLRANALHLARRPAEALSELKLFLAATDPQQPRPDIKAALKTLENEAASTQPMELATK